MKFPKILVLSLIAFSTLSLSARAEVDVKNAGFGCVVGGMILGGANVAQGNSIKTSAGAGAVGCAIGGIIANNTMTPAHAEEAPNEMDLKADDLKTLQDAKDLQNE